MPTHILMHKMLWKPNETHNNSLKLGEMCTPRGSVSWTVDCCLPAIVVSTLSFLFGTAAPGSSGDSRWADVTLDPGAEHTDLSKGNIWIFSGNAGTAILLLSMGESEVRGQEQLWTFFNCEGSPSSGHSPACYLDASTCHLWYPSACSLLPPPPTSLILSSSLCLKQPSRADILMSFEAQPHALSSRKPFLITLNS